MRRRLGPSIAFTLLFVGSCCALRSLQQNEAVVPALFSQGPNAAEKSNIQLNAPGTSNLLGAPALGPANGPLPAGIVSLAAKRNSNSAATTDAQDSLQATQQAYATTTVPGTKETGSFSVIKAIDNSGKGLAAGMSNKKLSAAQLAAAQQAVKKANEMSATNVTGPVVLGSQDGYEQILIHPTDKQKMTVDQVNNNAPVYSVPGGPTIQPQLITGSGMLAQTAQKAGPSPISPGQQLTAAQADASTTASSGTTTIVNAGGRTITVYVPTVGDNEEAQGDDLAGIVGVRISTPIFGTGFNFCVDRYFGSFPKVGIVVPNAAAWLLPEFEEVANALEHTLDLPSILPHGAQVDPTADGFLISLPTFQPSQLPEFGIRYGIQIGQAFGYDFGLGIVKDVCFVSFVIV